jgi:hypothetical protein
VRRIASAIVWLLISLLIVVPVSAWSAMALWFRFPGPDWARAAAAGLFVVFGLGTAIALFGRRRAMAAAAFALAFAALIVWWSTIRPPADGDWARDVAQQTTGTVDGDILTLSDVREFEWVSDTDFLERWSKRSYDLSKLKTLDLFLSYWAGPQMAHVADAFKSHTIVYLATAERDTVRLRSNVRGEDVRLYRLRTPPEGARALLLQYVAEANALAEEPAFYNSMTTNCTTAIVKLIRAAGGTLPFDWRLIVNGYLPGYLYDQGAVVTTIPLSELMERARIDDRARAADQSPDFSRLIRIGVPSPQDQTVQ